MKTAKLDRDDIINEVDDADLEEELRSCQHFLVDYELHKVFRKFVVNLNAKIVGEKLDDFFNKKNVQRKWI